MKEGEDVEIGSVRCSRHLYHSCVMYSVQARRAMLVVSE